MVQTIQQQEHHHAGSFYFEDEGVREAELKYLIKDNVMNIYHTEVDPKLQGKSIGFKLVQAVVNFAREKGLKVLPTCTFARSVFERTKDFHDVLV